MTVFHVYVSLADFGGDPLSGILIEAVATPAVKKSGTSVHSNAPERAYTGVDGTCTLNLLSIPGVWYQIRPVHSKGVFNPVNLAGYVPDVDDPTTGEVFPADTEINLKDVVDEDPSPGYEGINIGATSVNGQVGTIVLDAADVGAATAAQGALADTAVQPDDLTAYATDAELSAGLATKADTSHSHAIADTTGLQAALDAKAATSHTHTGVYAPALGADDNYVTDAEKAALHTHPAVIAQGATQADARTAIGLGTAATTAATAYATTAQGAKADTAVQPERLPLNIKDFGATGDGVTDDTDAFDDAIAHLATFAPQWIGGAYFFHTPELYVPAGIYRITRGLPVITFKGFAIRGDGMRNSVILYDGGQDVVIFDLGVFSATPGPAWQSADQISGSFENIRISNLWYSADGARRGQGIRSSGGGDLILRNVKVDQFKYGVNSPYGGDFNSYTNLTVGSCEVGIYQGPGGQQFTGFGVSVGGCLEGIVLDHAGQVNFYGTDFSASRTACLVIESFEAGTRQITDIPLGYIAYRLEQQIVFKGAWFESGVDGTDSLVSTHFVAFNSNATSYRYRGIQIEDAIIIAGQGPTKHTTSFMAFLGAGAQPHNVTILRPHLVTGVMDRWLTNPSSGQHTLIDTPQVNPLITPVPLWSDADTMYDGFQVKLNRFGQAGLDMEDRTIVPVLPKVDSVVSPAGSGTVVNRDVNGIIRLGFLNAGGWIYRLGFDIQQRRVYLDDPSGAAAMCLTRSAAMPTSGSYGIGSFVYNTAPVVAAGKTLLGWQRLTTGSAHVAGTDWTPVYGTTT